jgi:hypothetical protein
MVCEARGQTDEDRQTHSQRDAMPESAIGSGAREPRTSSWRNIMKIVVIGGAGLVDSQVVFSRRLATHHSRKVVANAPARYFGARLHDDTLVPGANPRLGTVNFDAWFTQTQAAH